MLENSNQILLVYEQDLEAWTRAWYDEAIARDFIRWPYDADAATLRRLHDYFHARLTPAEAAEACFERKH